METCQWLDQLHQNTSLYMPYKIDLDSQYFSSLKKKLNLLISILEKNNAPKALIACAKTIKLRL